MCGAKLANDLSTLETWAAFPGPGTQSVEVTYLRYDRTTVGIARSHVVKSGEAIPGIPKRLSVDYDAFDDLHATQGPRMS